MLNQIFPFGVILVYIVLFAMFMSGVGLGILQAGLKNTKGFGIGMISIMMFGIIVSFLVYHFIGWLGS